MHVRFATVSRLHVLLCLISLLSSAIFGGESTKRLDLYDGSDNHLMYVTFQYNEDGLNTGRLVFMSDGTFIRKVLISYDGLNRRVNEVSYNYNNDTVFVMTYAHSDADQVTSFNIVDQFKLDHVGGNVVYSNADPLNYGLVYEISGGQAASMVYTMDGDQLSRVDIVDQSGTGIYYGLFSTVGVKGTVKSRPRTVQQATIHSRGGSQIDVHLTLPGAGEVRCELLTLSGRRAAELLSGRFPQGSLHRRINLADGRHSRIADGMYLFVVSVNGVTVSSSRYLHQNIKAGGVQ